jgi:ketose-bisphosphate aldolase
MSGQKLSGCRVSGFQTDKTLKENSMALVKIFDVLKDMTARGEVLVCCNVFNDISIDGVLNAAKKANRPVMLGVTEPDLYHYGLEELVATVRIKAERARVDTALHLDHGMSLAMAAKCIRAGFSSVMIDPSNIEPARRVSTVREIVDFARSVDVMVESMVGQLKLALDVSGESGSQEELTDPDEAARFVRDTGMDILAVSVGTEHGSFVAGKTAAIDMARLAAIAEKVYIPLVIHGGSGVPNEQLREIRRYHVGKMNIGGALRVAYSKALMDAWTGNPLTDARDAEALGRQGITDAVFQKIKVLSC